jgi:hypothetical protein
MRSENGTTTLLEYFTVKIEVTDLLKAVVRGKTVGSMQRTLSIISCAMR